MSDTGLASLKSQCDTLKTNITRTSTSLRDFVSYYTDGQDAVAAVAGELSDLQAAADKIVDEPLDDVSVPASLATAANMLVGVCIESVNQLDSVLLSPQRSRSRHGDWLQDVAKQAAAMGKTLVPCSSGLHLAADSLVIFRHLLIAQQAGRAPPYGSSQMLPKISQLRALVADIDPSRGLQSLVLGQFIDVLEEQVQEASGGLLVPGSAGDQGSAARSPSPARAMPEVEPIRPYGPGEVVYPAAPRAISLRHVRKVDYPQDDFFCGDVSCLSWREPDAGAAAGVPAILAIANVGKTVSLINPVSGFKYSSHPFYATHMLFSAAGNIAATLSDAKWFTPQSRFERLEKQKLDSVLYHDCVHFTRPVVRAYTITKSVSGQPTWMLGTHLAWAGIRLLDVDRSGSYLAVAGLQNRIELYSLHSGSQVPHPVPFICCHTDEVTHAKFTPESSALVSLSRDGTIRVTDIVTGQGISRLEVDTWKTPTHLVVSLVPPDGLLVVSVWGNLVNLWNPDTGNMNSYNLNAVRGREGWPLCISGDSRLLACRTDEGIDISALATGDVLHRLKFSSPGVATMAAFSNDGRYLAFANAQRRKLGRSLEGHVDIWELTSN